MSMFANLSEMIVCTFNKFETGDSKDDSVDSIVKYVESNYIENVFKKNFKLLTVNDAQMLNRWNAEFLVEDGVVKKITID